LAFQEFLDESPVPEYGAVEQKSKPEQKKQIFLHPGSLLEQLDA